MRSVRGRDLNATAILTLIALVTRLLAVRWLPLPPAWDGVLYERGARAIAHGLGYSTFMFVHRSSDTVATAYYPVGYPAFLACLYRLFGTSLTIAATGGACVSALSVTFAHRIAWRFVPGWSARLAALALAVLPGQILFAGATMTEPLFGTLLVAAVYCFVRDPLRTGRASLVAGALLLAAATFVRPQAILLAPVLPLARDNAIRIGWRGRFFGGALATAIALSAIAPWSVRNCRDLDGCAFVSTNGGANLAIGAVPRANGRFFFLDDRDGCAGVRGEVARDRCWRQVARASVEAHPWHWLRLGLVKLDHTLSYEAFPAGYVREALAAPPQPGSLSVRSPAGFVRSTLPLDDIRERSWRRALTFPWRILLALAILALVPVHTRTLDAPAARTSLVACVVVLATHVVFFGGDRYHLPLAPLVAVIAAGAFRALPRMSTGPRRSGVVKAVRVREAGAEFLPFASL